MGVKISRNMNRMPTKLIPPPLLELGSKQSVEKGRESGFQLFGQPIFSNKHNLVATILVNSGVDITPLISTFEQTSKKLKVDLKVNKMVCDMNKDKNIYNNFDRAMQDYSNTNIFLVVIPKHIQSLYPKLKQQLLKAQGGIEMVSQFVTEFTLRKKGLQSIATKILLQMIAKRGNILWVPSYGEEMMNTLDRACLVGLDSSSKDGRALVSAVGTTNTTFSLLSSASVL